MHTGVDLVEFSLDGRIQRPTNFPKRSPLPADSTRRADQQTRREGWIVWVSRSKMQPVTAETDPTGSRPQRLYEPIACWGLDTAPTRSR